METFEEAKERLSAFLKQNHRSARLVWIFREDISQTGGITFFRTRSMDADEERVRKIYAQGISNDRGITISSMFYTNHCTAAYIWIPADDNEAINHLQGRCLKISVVEKGADPKYFREIGIKNGLLWRIVKLFNQKKNRIQSHFEDIPKRSTKF